MLTMVRATAPLGHADEFRHGPPHADGRPPGPPVHHHPVGTPRLPAGRRAPSSASSRQRSSARVAANMTAASNAGSLSGSRRSSTTVVSTSRLALREASLRARAPACYRRDGQGDRRAAPGSAGPCGDGRACRRKRRLSAAPGARGRLRRRRAPRGVQQDLVHAAHARADRLQRQRQRLVHQPLQAVLGRDQVRLEAVGLPDHLHVRRRIHRRQAPGLVVRKGHGVCG